MSYDVWLEINTGHRSVRFKDIGNYTSNVVHMWDQACSMAGSADLRDLDGKACGDIAAGLLRAVQCMVIAGPSMESMNPQNGWGDYKGALRYLARIAQACRDHPKAKLAIYR